jgi:hypothetical protein
MPARLKISPQVEALGCFPLGLAFFLGSLLRIHARIFSGATPRRAATSGGVNSVRSIAAETGIAVAPVRVLLADNRN